MSKPLRPKWAIEPTVSAAGSLHEEALLHLPALEPRIDPGLLAGIQADAAALRQDAATAQSKRADRKSATLSQEAALRLGAATVIGIRTAIRRAYPDDLGLQREFGVGQKLSAHSVGSVAAGLQTVLDAAAANPERVRSAGILPEDLEQAQHESEALVTADQAQDKHKVSAKDATARRLATHVRLEASLGKLLAAAAIAFRNQPDVLVRFEALIPARRRRNAVAVAAPSTTTTPA